MMDWVSLLGTYASLAGVALTLWQIKKIKTISLAAAAAATSAQNAITQNVFLVDVSTMANLVNEIKLSLRVCHHEVALLRVNDLIAQLHQAKALPLASENGRGEDLTNSIQQLAILRDSLDKYLRTKDAKVNFSNANTVLSNISGILNSAIGDTKYNLKTGAENG